jgi:hypothetical protein
VSIAANGDVGDDIAKLSAAVPIRFACPVGDLGVQWTVDAAGEHEQGAGAWGAFTDRLAALCAAPKSGAKMLAVIRRVEP